MSVSISIARNDNLEEKQTYFNVYLIDTPRTEV